ncbi:hypothetical protein F2P56_019391, partial [Juglans regia]
MDGRRVMGYIWWPINWDRCLACVIFWVIETFSFKMSMVCDPVSSYICSSFDMKHLLLCFSLFPLIFQCREVFYVVFMFGSVPVIVNRMLMNVNNILLNLF